MSNFAKIAAAGAVILTLVSPRSSDAQQSRVSTGTLLDRLEFTVARPIGHLIDALRISRPASVAQAEIEAEAKMNERGKAPGTLAVYSHGDPTPEEQYILELINRARANPTEEGERLASTTDPDVSFAYTYWNVNRNSVRTDFKAYPATPPLAFNEKLIASARRHSKDMADHDFQDHVGSDGSTFDQRINQAGYTGWTNAGENIFAYGKSMWHIHASFNVDFGVASLGHRQNIMNFSGGIFTEAGIGILQPSGGSVGPYITTQNFGLKTTRFITGVVYDDKNKNNFYDIGEGIAGVTITPDKGTTTAVTSTSGGYAIPFSTSGSVKVTASGGTFGTPVSKTITFDGVNVKVDFNPDASGLPGTVSLVRPAETATVVGDTIRLLWNKVTGATKYRVQVATNPEMTDFVLNDANVTDTTKLLFPTKDGQTYYWRVAAINAKGTGENSATQTFTAALLPRATALVEPASDAQLEAGAVTFRWRGTQPRTQKYWLQIATASSFATFVHTDSNIVDTFSVVSTLEPGKTYYWRVRSANSDGWGAMSPTRTLQITSSSAVDLAESGPIVVYPNPAVGVVTFKLGSFAEPGSTLSIISAAGQRILTIPVTGEEVRWDATQLAQGTYFYELQTPTNTATGSLKIVR